MPFSELPSEFPPQGDYTFQVQLFPESVASVSFTFALNWMPGGGDPDWSVLDSVAQDVVDRLSAIPGSIVTASKARGVAQEITPTTTEEVPQ